MFKTTGTKAVDLKSAPVAEVMKSHVRCFHTFEFFNFKKFRSQITDQKCAFILCKCYITFCGALLQCCS